MLNRFMMVHNLLDNELSPKSVDNYISLNISDIELFDIYGLEHLHTRYMQIYCNMGCGSCPSRTALFVGRRFKYENMNEEKERENTSHWQADELQGKVGQCFLSDGKVGPQVVSEKIILAVLRYFPRKPCLSGSISRNALVVQRTAKVRVLTI